MIPPPQMPPVGGDVESRPHAPAVRVVTRTSPAIAIVLLVAGALIGGGAVYLRTQVSLRDARSEQPPPVAPTAPPTLTVVEGPPPVPAIAPVAPVAPIVDPAPTPVAPQACDEVSCVLDNNEPACCARYGKPKITIVEPGETVAPDGAVLPDGLDREMISDAVGRVKPAIQACGDRSAARGRVKVRVRVQPAGTLGDVVISESPDAALGDCVAAAMRTLAFPATHNGGSFGYPFVF